MVDASELDMAEFLPVAPVIPVLLFALAIAGVVFLAYALGARKFFKEDLVEILRDDSL